MRMLRREWRQQLLILALITVAVAATVVGSAVATTTPSPATAAFGTAQDLATFTGPAPRVAAEVASISRRFGTVDVIENQTLLVPGSIQTYSLRAQNPHGPFGQPMLSLISGRFPVGAGQVAVTGGVASDFHLAVGSSWTVGGVSRKVTGIVQNPQNLLDEFALVAPGQVSAPTQVTVLFDAPGVSPADIGPTVTTPQTVAANSVFNPETISLAAAVLGMLLIAMVGAGGFTVLAQRRLRSIGMLAAQGATQSSIRLVVRANGVATGVIGAAAGFALGVAAWLAYRPHVQASAHHVIGTFQLPWTVVWISMILAVLATYVAAARPARAIARVPVVAALSGRPPAPKAVRHLAVPFGLGFLALAFFLLGMVGAGAGNGASGVSKAQLQELVGGFVALVAAVVLLSPACLAVLARLGRWTPVMVRIALRDLARYRARSGPALAAISLSVLIAAIVMVISAARFGGAIDYVGPNLASSQLVVYPPGHDNPNGPPPTASQLAAAQASAQRIAASLDDRYLITLQTPSGSLQYGGSGRSGPGTTYVATPQLLNAFGITPAQVNPDADFLTMRPGLSTTQHMQLWDTRKVPPDTPCLPGSCLANPPIQEIGALPSGTSAPNTVITEHAMREFRFTATTAGWLIQAPGGLTATQITNASADRGHGRGEHRDRQQHPVAHAGHRRGHDLRARARARHPRDEHRPGPQRDRQRPAHADRHRSEQHRPPHAHRGHRRRARADRGGGRNGRGLSRGDRLLQDQQARPAFRAGQRPGGRPAVDRCRHAADRGGRELAACRARTARHRPPATRITERNCASARRQFGVAKARGWS